jgi:hypothetical protein
LFSEQYFTYRNQISHQLQSIPKIINFTVKSQFPENKRNAEPPTHHRQRIDEVAVDGVQRARVVVRRSTDRGEIDRLQQKQTQKSESSTQ